MTTTEKEQKAAKTRSALKGKPKSAETLAKRAATIAARTQQQKDATSAKLSKSLTKAWANRK